MKYIILFTALVCSITAFAHDTIVDDRTGIKIIFSADGKIFPDNWYEENINAQGISLDTTEYNRSEKIVKAALQKYPVELLKKNIKKIYILKNVTFYGQSFGGTNSTSNVYLSNNGINEGYTDFYLEQLFHKEFSSILLRNYKKNFKEEEWVKYNSDDFTYGNGGVQALKDNKDSENLDTELNKAGFINQYATSSIENDFNAFAGNLFLPKNEFIQAITDHNNLKKKRKIIMEFYSKLDNSFTEKYFDEILYKITTSIEDGDDSKNAKGNH